jgi:hypothetical protein
VKDNARVGGYVWIGAFTTLHRGPILQRRVPVSSAVVCRGHAERIYFLFDAVGLPVKEITAEPSPGA